MGNASPEDNSTLPGDSKVVDSELDQGPLNHAMPHLHVMSFAYSMVLKSPQASGGCAADPTSWLPFHSLDCWLFCGGQRTDWLSI